MTAGRRRCARRAGLLPLVLGGLLVALAGGCKGGAGGGGGGGLTIDRVIVSPVQQALLPGASTQLTATVEGTNPDHRVAWTLEAPAATGAEAGTVSESGLYTAPELVPSGTVEVVATSLANPARSGRTTVSLGFELLVTPAQPVVVRGGNLQLHATVRGAVDQRVVWSAGWGRVDAGGTYTAPTEQWQYQDVVTARAPQAGDASASVTVSFVNPPPVISSISGPATAGDLLTVRGSGFVADTLVAFPGAAGRELRVPATVISSQEVRARVPVGAASGLLAAELEAGAVPATRSNAVPFERIPRLRLHPARRDVAAGEPVAIAVAFLGGEPAPLTWSAEAGTVADGVYTPPAAVAGPSYTRVTACVTGTSSCASVLLGVLPFRVEPEQPVIAAGQAIDLAAIGASGPLLATWELVEGSGTLQGSRYTAPSRLADASRIRLRARAGGAAQEVEVAVTGLAPGLVARLADHVDFRSGQAPWQGISGDLVAASGSRAYVLAVDRVTSWAERTLPFIDVYDVADPLRPAWLGAVEALAYPSAMWVAGDRLVLLTSIDWAAGLAPNLVVYDLFGPLPVPLDQAAWDPGATGDWNTWARDGQRIYAADRTSSSTLDRLSIRLYDVAGGATPVGRRELALPRPSFLRGMVARDGRLYVGLAGYDFGPMEPYLAVYDVAAEPATMLFEVKGTDSPQQFVGPLLYAYPGIYDVSGPAPSLVGTLPFGPLVDAPDGRATLANYYDLDIFDVSRPQAPQRLGSVVAGSARTWVGPWLYAAEGAGGLAIYEVGPPGGPVFRGMGAGGTCAQLNGEQLASNGRTLYVAGATKCGDAPPIPFGEVAAYDLATTPPAYLGSALEYHDDALSIALVGEGGLAFVGHELGLKLYDLSDSTAPIALSTTPYRGARLAQRGNLLFAATSEGRLAVLDVALPSSPIEIGSAPLAGTPHRVRLEGDLLLASLGADGLALYDVSVPAAPILLAQVRLEGPVEDALAAGEVVLAAAGQAGLVSLDVGDPSRPSVAGAVLLEPAIDRFWPTDPRPGAAGLDLHDGLLFVGSRGGLGAFHAFDVRDPRRPALASLSFQGGGVAFLWNGSDLLATGGGAVTQIDMTRPRNVGAIRPPDAALLPGR